MKDFKYAHLWNDLPKEERLRLMPFLIESQILHIQQTKATIIRNHKKALLEINNHIKNLQEELKRYENK